MLFETKSIRSEISEINYKHFFKISLKLSFYILCVLVHIQFGLLLVGHLIISVFNSLLLSWKTKAGFGTLFLLLFYNTSCIIQICCNRDQVFKLRSRDKIDIFLLRMLQNGRWLLLFIANEGRFNKHFCTWVFISVK